MIHTDQNPDHPSPSPANEEIFPPNPSDAQADLEAEALAFNAGNPPPDPRREAMRYPRFSYNDRTQIGNPFASDLTLPETRARLDRTPHRHGSTALTLLLPGECEDDWLSLLDRWCLAYKIPAGDDAAENTLAFDFVLKAAQAEWRRIRCQTQYDDCLLHFESRLAYRWSDAEIKTHERLLRYKNSAERSFQRDARAVEQFYRVHHPGLIAKNVPATPASHAEPTEEDESSGGGNLTIIGANPNSPTGYVIACKIENFCEDLAAEGQPYTPPDPLPPDWIDWYADDPFPKNKPAAAPQTAPPQ